MNTNNTTIYDLKESALACAKLCIDTDNTRKDDLAVQSTQLESFNAAGHDRADFGTWQSYVNEFIANVIGWKKTLSPAAQAAAQAAQATKPTA